MKDFDCETGLNFGFHWDRQEHERLSLTFTKTKGKKKQKPT